jgi:hypothetical protein
MYWCLEKLFHVLLLLTLLTALLLISDHEVMFGFSIRVHWCLSDAVLLPHSAELNLKSWLSERKLNQICRRSWVMFQRMLTHVLRSDVVLSSFETLCLFLASRVIEVINRATIFQVSL